TPSSSAAASRLFRGCAMLRALAANFLPRIGDLAHFALAFPAGHMDLVQFHETLGPFAHLRLRGAFEDGITADHLLGLGEWAVGERDFAACKPRPHAARRRQQADSMHHSAPGV